MQISGNIQIPKIIISTLIKPSGESYAWSVWEAVYPSEDGGKGITTAGVKGLQFKKSSAYLISLMKDDILTFNTDSSSGHDWIKWENAFKTLGQSLAQ